MLVSLDLETECAVEGCTDGQCQHALIPHLSRITVIGVWSPEYKKVFRQLGPVPAALRLTQWLVECPIEVDGFVGHNLKFDIKQLCYHEPLFKKIFFDEEEGTDGWAHDTSLMEVASYEKVSADYLDWYETKRKELNKSRKGKSHREAGQHSLKTLAPYFLQVPPFWEPEIHDDDTYVLKDAEYCYRLYEFLLPKLKQQGTYEFYETKLMPWSKMLLEAEMRGISLDMEKVNQGAETSLRKAEEVKKQLDEEWKDAYAAYLEIQDAELWRNYQEKAQAQRIKMKAPSEDKCIKLNARYQTLYEKAAAKLDTKINLGSPAQLKWLLKDYLKLDIRDYEGNEGTDRAVLHKLAQTGRKDIELLLEHRKQMKLATAFYPSYQEIQDNGIIRCSFNPTGTVTGRLSSNGPNLQQVPGDLHSLFIARPGYNLITRDLSSIEPRLIAFFTEDPFLCDLMIRGGDFHSNNAKIMLALDCDEAEIKERFPKERKIAKTAGLALFYGARTNRIRNTALQAGYDWSQGMCKEIYENFREAYRTAFEYKEELDKLAVHSPIESLFGRKRYFEDPEEIFMAAFNSKVQASASDLLVESGYRAKTRFTAEGLDARPLLFVHDELIVEASEEHTKRAERIVEEELTSWKLETPYGLIPMACEGKTGRAWEK